MKLKTGLRRILVLISIVIILTIANWLGLMNPLRNVFVKITAPLLSLTYNLKIQQEIAFLETKVAQLMRENSDLKLLIQENKLIAKQQKYLETAALEGVSARVLSRSRDILLLNKGTDDGVEIGRPVITENGIIIAKIDKVFADYAQAMLLTSKESKLAAEIQNKNAAQGIVMGFHSLGLEMQFIPKGENLNVGDTVVTSGMEEKITRGLLVGEIANIESKESELFLKVSIDSPIKYQNVTTAIIITQ